MRSTPGGPSRAQPSSHSGQIRATLPDLNATQSVFTLECLESCADFPLLTCSGERERHQKTVFVLFAVLQANVAAMQLVERETLLFRRETEF